jgi:hypothetical protein
MNDETRLRALLQDGDPVRAEKGLATMDAERMRRRIVAAAAEPVPAWTPWHRPLAVAAIVLLLVVVGSIRHDGTIDPAPAPSDPVAISGSGGDGSRRQLQFSTPGGTRIIWIFDQNLRLQESMP